MEIWSGLKLCFQTTIKSLCFSRSVLIMKINDKDSEIKGSAGCYTIIVVIMVSSSPHSTALSLLNSKMYILFELDHPSSCNHSLKLINSCFWSAYSTPLKWTQMIQSESHIQCSFGTISFLILKHFQWFRQCPVNKSQ